ncbi:MAG TPA: hypothetical protein VGM90_37280 [Kofleriaceae bacterium]|jgi:hypothetical protein
MSYAIADDPVETSLRRYASRPMVAIYALIVAGSWLAWPWFAFNSFALGSATKRRELTLLAISILGSIALAWGMFELVAIGVIHPGTQLLLARLGVATFKIVLACQIASLQRDAVQVHIYDGAAIEFHLPVFHVGNAIAMLVLTTFSDPLIRVVLEGVRV